MAVVEETGSVTSTDGTTIGYRFFGQGPPTILVPGAGQTSENLTTLGHDLAAQLTIYLPDRRGRGMSGPCRADHGLRTEVEDLSALLDATGAHFVFGLSAGAVIALQAALVRPDITKLALYEPPLITATVAHGEWAPRYEQQLRAGHLGGAIVAVLKGTADRDAWIRFVPAPVLSIPLNLLLRLTQRRPVPPGTSAPRDLIATVHYDIQTVADAAGPVERFAGVGCHVLLLGGSKSALNMTSSLDELEPVLPHVERVTLAGVGHPAPDNRKQPHRVAGELRRFFSTTQ